MALVNHNSLSETLGNLNDALLAGQRISPAEGREMGEWIASRVDAPRSYRGLPAPTGRDYSTKLRLFSGESVGSRAGAGCKLGFEATWALAVLAPHDAAVAKAAEACRRISIERFTQEQARRRGMYCCYSCSNAGWRVLGVCTDGDARELLEAGLSLLGSLHDKNARWRQFPFWYTVLALHDLDSPTALAELRFAAPALERALRGRAEDQFNRRRRLLAQRVLERV